MTLLLVSCGRGIKRYNLVVIYTDDQRYDTVHELGYDEVITPNLDRLVRMGTAFTHAHVMGSMHGAVCAPSRAMLLSGRPYHHIPRKYIDLGEPPLSFDFETFPEQLRKEGYETFFTGKWHNNTGKLTSGFEDGENIFIGGMHQLKKGGHHNPDLWHYDPSGQYKISDLFKGQRFSSQLYTDAALTFLKKDHNKPFCLYLAYSAPHDPREAPEEFVNMYDTAMIQLPASFMPIHPFDNGHLGIRDELLAPFPRTPERIKQEIKGYYAMISEVDHQIGRILNYLEEEDLLDETIIVFAGDNGLAVGKHGLLGKQNLYDHSARIPLVFVGPNVPQGVRASTLCYIHDIYPTIVDLLGYTAAPSVEGLSLVPAMQDPDIDLREYVYLAHAQQMRAIRTKDDVKLILTYFKGVRNIQLFDLASDPDELNNLSVKSSWQSKKDKLLSILGDKVMQYRDGFFEPELRIHFVDWKHPVRLELGSIVPELEVRFDDTAEGLASTQTVYTEPIVVNKGLNIAYQSYYQGEPASAIHTSTLKDVTTIKDIDWSRAPVDKYMAYGKYSLVDGLRGDINKNRSNWLGFLGGEVSFTVELHEAKNLKTVGVSFMQSLGQWIFPPAYVEVAVSRDGLEYETILKKEYEMNPSLEHTAVDCSVTTVSEGIRYIRYSMRTTSHIPDWHVGAGGQPWLFIDELIF